MQCCWEAHSNPGEKHNHQVGQAIASFGSSLASASLWNWSRASGTYSAHTHSILSLLSHLMRNKRCTMLHVCGKRIFLQRTSRPWLRSPVMHFCIMHEVCLAGVLVWDLRDMMCWQHILVWHNNTFTFPAERRSNSCVALETACIYCTFYRGGNKGLHVVARNVFLLLLNCSAWPCLGPA